MLSQLMYISCFGWCYCQIISWQILLPCLWQMLLPLDVVDVFTTFTFYIVNIIILADVMDNPYCGRSYCHLFCGRCCTTFILDAISLSCQVADVIANFCGRWKTTFHSGVIYRFKCNRVECDEEYIGESARNFGERFKKHQKSPSPIHDHINISGHTVSTEDFSILAREDQNLLRTIKEAIYIRANNPSLNRNVGKFHLPHIWDEVLLNIS